LQKIFDPPDSAPDGQGALALATERPYDVIFLDVEMPGMDGFELCKKIRQTTPNRTTPVVFVTRHSDFDSRARTAMAGGNELIGKPFLALEIAVKALSLVLASRQRRNTPALKPADARIDPAAVSEPSEPDNRSNGFTKAAASINNSRKSRSAKRRSAKKTRATAAKGPPQVHDKLESGVEEPVPTVSGQSANEEVQFEKLKSQMKSAMLAQHAGARQDMLGQLFIGVHELTLQTKRDGQKTAHRLSATLEDLLRKLLERPALCTTFVLDAVNDGLDLLGELHAFGADPELLEDTFRILVVDDDPIALRAVAGSLQLVFGRPERAESGEAALELTGETTFDLILLDVVMPGMDGFETCAKIRQTHTNRETPILFVTSHDDEPSRRKALAVGGCGFITKPVLPKEILLRALTLMLRQRRVSPSLACAF
jgi:CheY-like chemotaxis protein